MLGLFKKKLPHCDKLFEKFFSPWYDQVDRPTMTRPYFYSIIVHKDTGFGITVFDWAIKKFSEYGVDDGFAAKFQMALESVKQSK